ncbi:hypothetical protein HK097_001776 [Rhizophlyctis rosea]|uniref:NAD(+) kinase n=1 Tax=Rhizophlyctis rosea TaxID=64517 RepID=A0AAD5SBZ7_9FUNG|nr:hypothetical protein HK097_001776 [Rhizophlyctis rosea]
MNPMLATGKDDDEITIPGSPGARLHPASHQLDIGDLLAKVSTQLTCEADDEPEPIPHRKPSAGSRSPTSPLRPLSVGSAPSLLASKPVAAETFQILNDLVVDRGPSAYMSQLELFVDDRHLTTVQADGLVLSTPTGSTAYSLSAGGSLVHPEVPSFLVTPICPHTLSFRPMLLPDSIELKIQVPADSRSTAWASFDGRHRIELKQGDYITVGLSRWPMPTVCEADQSSDWFESLRRCLHWNERTRQKGFDPMSSAPLSPSTNVLINPISRFQMEAEGEHHKAVFGIGSDGGMESPEDELGGAGDEDFLVREMGMG